MGSITQKKSWPPQCARFTHIRCKRELVEVRRLSWLLRRVVSGVVWRGDRIPHAPLFRITRMVQVSRWCQLLLADAVLAAVGCGIATLDHQNLQCNPSGSSKIVARVVASLAGASTAGPSNLSLNGWQCSKK